jgi:uncharacterized Zn finger protein (UPF0148 family)
MAVWVCPVCGVEVHCPPREDGEPPECRHTRLEEMQGLQPAEMQKIYSKENDESEGSE